MFDELARGLWVAAFNPRKVARKARKYWGKIIPRRPDLPYYHDPARGLLGSKHAENRIVALAGVLADSADRTVLDLGCAEGLMAEKFLQAGARHVTAFDVRPERIATARRLMPTQLARFEVGDLSDWAAFERSHELLAGYDIVLFLGVYQHLPATTRAATLRGVARKTLRSLALRAPAELLKEIDDILQGAGLVLTDERRGNGLGVGRFRLYERPGSSSPHVALNGRNSAPPKRSQLENLAISRNASR